MSNFKQGLLLVQKQLKRQNSAIFLTMQNEKNKSFYFSIPGTVYNYFASVCDEDAVTPETCADSIVCTINEKLEVLRAQLLKLQIDEVFNKPGPPNCVKLRCFWCGMTVLYEGKVTKNTRKTCPRCGSYCY